MSQNYDYIVIGSDLGSLAIACALSQNTKSVALIDGQDFAGSDCKAVNFPTGTISNGLHFTPDTELTKKAVSFLESLVEQPVLGPQREIPPMTFEQGQLKEFLGFGEKNPDFYEEIKFFTSTNRRELLVPSHQWAQLLIQKFQGDFLPRSYVTKFEVTNGKVTGVKINGAKVITGLNFIFCGPLKDLTRLLPQDALNQKTRTKLAKNDFWNALYLDLCHGHQVTDSTAVHILNGTTDDEIGPCAGMFQPATAEGMQVSQWVTFVADDNYSDEPEEVIGQALKKMKRQIKRAYPTALDGLKSERLRWAPLISGTAELKLSGQQTLGDIENLWVASAAVHNQKFWVGSLLQAQLVLAAMGFQTQEIENTQEESAETQESESVHP
jgi:hypothetical protein